MVPQDFMILRETQCRAIPLKTIVIPTKDS
jgi:hypothetical protein